MEYLGESISSIAESLKEISKQLESLDKTIYQGIKFISEELYNEN